MQIILLGPPGSGKGTQAGLVSLKLSIPHISSGDMLRETIKEGSDLGRKAKSFLDQGELVPDEVILGIIKRRIGRQDCQGGFLLDGFPRTTSQAKALDETLTGMKRGVDVVIDLKVSDKLAAERLSGRLTCVRCGANFNLDTSLPKTKGRCDMCGGELEHRTDDTGEVIKNRLKVYHCQTEPIEEYYKRQGKLVEVQGEGRADAVSRKIFQILKKKSCSFK